MKLVIILMFVLLFFQYRTTKLTDYTGLTEMERVAQLRRMNEYPPSTYRLANWIEARKEAIIYFKLEKNFVDTFDLRLLFSKYVNPIFLPLFLLGLFEAVKLNPKPVLFIVSLPVILLTVIGHQNPNGPFSLFPVIYAGAVFGLIRLISVIRREYEK